MSSEKPDLSLTLRYFPLDRKVMGNLIFFIANRGDFPFHHKFRAVFTVIE